MVAPPTPVSTQVLTLAYIYCVIDLSSYGCLLHSLHIDSPAKAACLANNGCGGVTIEPDSTVQLRAGTDPSVRTPPAVNGELVYFLCRCFVIEAAS